MANQIIQKNIRSSTDHDYQFSVLIPTWNNLPYLQCCIKSIRKNSTKDLQLIVFVNEGKDGTLDWLAQQEDIDYLYSSTNLGICYALNACRSVVRSAHILYLNDDMYVLPQWDTVLWEQIQSLDTPYFMLSGTMLEPVDTQNPCVIHADFGRRLEDFKEDQLLEQAEKFSIPDWSGSTWPPNVVPVALWDLVGGMSVEFSPGMYSDPDLSKKLFDAGTRIFLGKGNSLVYHFGSKSTGRISKNDGRTKFLVKHGITPGFFTKHYLKLGEVYQGKVTTPKISFLYELKHWWKKLWASLY